MKKAIFVILSIFFILVAFLVYYLAQVFYYGQEWRVVPQYYVNVGPKESKIILPFPPEKSPQIKTIKNLEIITPFPHKNDKPIYKLFDKIKEDYKNYGNYPDLKIDLIDTNHGKMLRLYLPEMYEIKNKDNAFELRFGLGMGGRVGFDEPVSLGDPDSRYELKPRFNIKKLSKDRKVSQTWAYFDWEGVSNLEVSGTYVLNWSRPGFSHPISNGRLAKIGVTSLNPYNDNRPIHYPAVFEITKKGWQKLPVAE